MEQNASHDIFTDPALVRAKQEDPFFKFISQHWRELVVGAVVIFGGYYVVTQLRKTQYESKVSASDLFQKAQESFTEIVALEQRLSGLSAKPADPKAAEAQAKERADIEIKLKEANDKLTQRVAALNDVKAPYSNIGPLYKALSAARTGDVVGMESFTSQVKQGGGPVIFNELAELAAARTLLDDSSKRSDGFKRLLNLVSSSTYVGASAAATLGKVAATPEERTEVLKAMEAFIAKSPEQTDLLKEDMARLQGENLD